MATDTKLAENITETIMGLYDPNYPNHLVTTTVSELVARLNTTTRQDIVTIASQYPQDAGPQDSSGYHYHGVATRVRNSIMMALGHTIR